MKDFHDVNTAYRAARKSRPGQAAVFCCDLGDSWLFKFVPKAHLNDPNYICGCIGTAVNKESGEIRPYNMLEHSGELAHARVHLLFYERHEPF